MTPVRENDNNNRVYLDEGVGQDPHDPKPSFQEVQRLEDLPFCIGIVGDFSGGGRLGNVSENPELARRPIRRVTPENVLDFAGLSPEILVTGLSEAPSGTPIQLSAMEDLHPNTLYAKLALFARHREARERLLAGGALEPGEPEDPPKPPDTDEPSVPGGTDLLDAVLGETAAETEAARPELEEDLDAFLRRVVRPHILKTEPDQSDQIEELDRQTDILMGHLLGAPPLKKMEALWRSVVFLLSRVEVSSRLRIYLIDVSEQELASDLLSTDEPAEWGFAHTVLNPISEHGEEIRWGALLGQFNFGNEPDQLHLLQRIGLLAESGGVPWFAGAQVSLLGAQSLRDQTDPRDWTDAVDPLWHQLRENPEAEWISLSLPGFLLRAPYGPRTKGAKRFTSDQSGISPEGLPWGNPSILCGVVLAQEFARSGWEIRPHGRSTLSQLPMVFSSEDRTTCLEENLSISAATQIREMGLIPVVANRNESELRLQGLDSISAGNKGIRAWWENPLQT